MNRLDGVAVDGWKLDGQNVDAWYLDGLPIWHSNPRPVISRFTTLPLHLLRSAGPLSVLNFDARFTPADAVGVITDPSGLVVANGLRAPGIDTRYKLTVTEPGRTPAVAYYDLIRTLAPSISSFTVSNYVNTPNLYSWRFNATILAHPGILHDDLYITGATAGRLRGVSARALQVQANTDEFTGSWQHAVGGRTAPASQVFTLTVINRDSLGNEIGRATATVNAPN